MAEVNTFYQSQYTGEQLDEILKNVYDAVPLDGSKPMTAPLTIKEVENGYTQLEKNHTQTTDLGTALRDVSKGGSVVALLLKAADQAARLQFGASVYDLIHTGNITGYVKPYADTAQAASEAAESALEGVREAIEAIPEGAATPIVNDLTTGGTSMALSAEMGKQLKTELNTRVNPNLLDNWYFGNPVNQRGQTDYNGPAGYTIDRWRTSNANTGVAVADDSIFLVAAVGATPYLLQTPQAWQRLLGRTVTLSILSDGQLKTATSKLPEAVPSTATLYCTIGEYGHVIALAGKLHVRLTGPVSEGRNFTAVKLEFGAEQTLAHQEDGVWVLNEMPDYGLELLKCQRYYQLFSSEATRPTALADYRPSMRVTPATGTIDIDGVTYYYADANL